MSRLIVFCLHLHCEMVYWWWLAQPTSMAIAPQMPAIAKGFFKHNIMMNK